MAAIRLISRTVLAVAAATGATLVPVTANAAPPPVQEINLINLSIREDNAQSAYRTAVLLCEPAAGTHPNAERACASLAKANGDFGALRSENSNSMCPMIYEPITVTAKGTWHNKPLEFTKVYSNSCMLKAQTGDVFAF